MKNLDSPGLDAADHKLLEDVRDYGWHCAWVPPEGDDYEWGFTIGLQATHAHPELMLFGLPQPTGHALLQGLVERIEAGERLVPNARDERVIQGMPGTFLEVRTRWYEPLLGFARWFYEGDDFSVLQCVWPDRDGRLPGDAGFSAEVARLQPLLDREEAEAAGMSELLRALGD